MSSAGACGAASSTATVTINALPARPTLTVVYNGTTTTLTSSAATGNQFYLNGTAIAGATGPAYVVNGTPAQYGAYTLTTTSAQGCASLPSTAVVVTATAKQLATATLQVYPNPTPGGRLTVALTGAHQLVQLTVLNAVGQVVHRGPLAAAATEQSLDLNALPSGVYLLRAATAEGSVSRRFVRE